MGYSVWTITNVILSQPSLRHSHECIFFLNNPLIYVNDYVYGGFIIGCISERVYHRLSRQVTQVIACSCAEPIPAILAASRYAWAKSE